MTLANLLFKILLHWNKINTTKIIYFTTIYGYAYMCVYIYRGMRTT